MKTRILLINFTEKEKKAVAELGVEVDIGYLSDAYTLSGSDKDEPSADLFSPFAIYDYKAIFIKLTKNPPLEKDSFGDDGSYSVIGEKERITFLKYWYDNKGVLTVFADDCDFRSLNVIGIPQLSLENSRGNDKTVFFSLKSEDRPVRKILEEIESLVSLPPKKYIKIQSSESKGTGKNWTVFPVYSNRNDEVVGAYLNWGYKFEDEDSPAFLVLPSYKNYSEIITKLLKGYAKVDPKYFSEISNLEWTKRDSFYPKEVGLVDDEIKQLVSETEKKVNELKAKKAQLKSEYSYLKDLLTETGDKLKKAVIAVLSDVFHLEIEDVDEGKKNDFREDILIKDGTSPPILTEVKGTRSSYPSFTYVTQVFSNLLKGRNKYPDATGGLILNYDRDREPGERAKAYTNADEEKQLDEIVYIDTRVLFDLALAVIDHGLSVSEANKMLLKKGRVNFSLNKYLKDKK